MTRQVTDQLYIELEYFTPEEYYVYIAEAVIAVSSVGSLTCDATEIAGGTVVEASGSWSSAASVTVSANKIIQGQSALVSAFIQTVTISHIEGADLVAFSNANIAIQITVIRQANVQLTSVFSAAIDAVRGIYISAQADSTATTVAVGQRVRFTEAAFIAAFSPTMTVNAVKNTFAVLDSQATMSVAASKLTGVIASLSSASTLVAQGGKVVNASVSLTSIATLFASRNIARGRPVQLTATGTTFNSSIKQYGSHSLSFTNTSSQIIFTNDNFEMEIPANTNFLIEFWINPNGGNVSGTDNLLLGVGDMTSLASMNANDSWALGITNNGRLDFKYATASNTFNTISTSNGTLNGSSNWFHFVITRYNGEIFLVNNYTGGSNGATSTYTGAIYQGSYKKLKFRNPFSSSLLLDDFNFKIGFGDDGGEGENVSAQAVNDPDKSVFLYHFNNNLVDDTAATFNQSAALASISSVTATISGPQRTSAAIVSQSTLVAQATKTSEINLVAFSNASLTTAITRVRSSDVTLVSQFTQASSAGKIVNVISTQSSQFTQASTAVKTVAPVISTNAIFSELVAIAKTGQGFIQADVVATMSVAAVKTTNVTLAAASAFTSTATAVKTTNATTSLSSITSLTVDNSRTRNSSSSLESNAQLTTNINEIVQLAASLTAVTSVLADTSGIKEFSVTITSQASVSSTILRIRDGFSSLASSFTQTATTNNSRLVGAAATVSSQAIVIANVGTVKTSAITTTAIFSELAAIAKTGQGFITLDVIANQNTIAVKTASAVSSQTANSSVVANIVKIVNGQLSLSSTAAFTASGTIVSATSANISASATLTCNVAKTVNVISIEASAGTLSAVISVTKRTTISMSALAFEVAVINKTTLLQANITSQATLTAKIGGTFGAQISMQGFAAEVAVIDVIHIDAKLTWMIQAENRTANIQADSRIYSIIEEDRTYDIVNEDRSYSVTRELLEFDLQGP